VISNLISWAKVRYVLDTCVVVSALRSRNGASNRVLRLALLGKIPLVCHYKLLSEYREVLFRMVRREELVYSRDQVERVLAALDRGARGGSAVSLAAEPSGRRG
jgi:predicted nucleic acid-binding protein